MVQRKWMYLESIFASDDIRMQLPEEAKKFNKTDLAYKKIMESAYKNPNVL
jgi:dynein heavy chain, axonemal